MSALGRKSPLMAGRHRPIGVTEGAMPAPKMAGREVGLFRNFSSSIAARIVVPISYTGTFAKSLNSMTTRLPLCSADRANLSVNADAHRRGFARAAVAGYLAR